MNISAIENSWMCIYARGNMWDLVVLHIQSGPAASSAVSTSLVLCYSLRNTTFLLLS